MIRLLAIQVGLFFLPFLVYALLLALKRRALSAGLLREEAPLGGLALVGLLLVIGTFLGLAAFDGGSATGTYVPDRFENGRLVPGHIE
jgi:hypothetical protein